MPKHWLSVANEWSYGCACGHIESGELTREDAIKEHIATENAKDKDPMADQISANVILKAWHENKCKSEDCKFLGLEYNAGHCSHPKDQTLTPYYNRDGVKLCQLEHCKFFGYPYGKHCNHQSDANERMKASKAEN